MPKYAAQQDPCVQADAAVLPLQHMVLTTITCLPFTGRRDCIDMVPLPEDWVPTYELVLRKSISRFSGSGWIERTRSAVMKALLEMD